ncbi:MAG: hypothetical protein R3268_08910 [Acidiferrobacterales bacterium]|nr:hypothetical protein [Acidiferrobacterales bacterium]
MITVLDPGVYTGSWLLESGDVLMAAVPDTVVLQGAPGQKVIETKGVVEEVRLDGIVVDGGRIGILGSFKNSTIRCAVQGTERIGVKLTDTEDCDIDLVVADCAYSGLSMVSGCAGNTIRASGTNNNWHQGGVNGHGQVVIKNHPGNADNTVEYMSFRDFCGVGLRLGSDYVDVLWAELLMDAPAGCVRGEGIAINGSHVYVHAGKVRGAYVAGCLVSADGKAGGDIEDVRVSNLEVQNSSQSEAAAHAAFQAVARNGAMLNGLTFLSPYASDVQPSPTQNAMSFVEAGGFIEGARVIGLEAHGNLNNDIKFSSPGLAQRVTVL